MQYHGGSSGRVRGLAVGIALCALVLTSASGASAASPGSTALLPGGGSAAATYHGFVPLSPVRLLDTRPDGQTFDGQSQRGGAVGAGQSVTFPVAGRGGVPPSGIGSVVLNVTVTGGTAGSHLTVFADGDPVPATSNLNMLAGQTVANSVVTKVGANGQVRARNNAGAVHVIVDLAGYFPAGGTMHPVAPARLADTRAGGTTVDGIAAGGGAIGSGASRNIPVDHRAGVGDTPPGPAAVAILNVTATSASAPTHLSIDADNLGTPPTSSLNVPTGRTVANLVMVRIGSGIKVRNNAGTVDVIVDVVGWIEGPLDGSSYVATNPSRLVDTRPNAGTVDGFDAGAGALGPGEQRTITLRGYAPWSGIGAVVLNVTGISPTAGTHLSVFPSGEARPNASNVNLPAGATVPNLVVAKPGTNGAITIYNNSGFVHLVVDIVGWFSATGTGPDGVSGLSPAPSLTFTPLDLQGKDALPWDIAFLPDATMLYTQRAGSINARVGSEIRTLGTVPDIFASGEYGLLGLAVDPQFATNRNIYACVATTAFGFVDMKVVRWRVNETLTGLTNRTDILTGIPLNAASSFHGGCRLRFGPDGNLWVTTGDTFNGGVAQDKQSLGGKVLRITRDGAPAAGNPGGALRPEIYTYGHRNPQGLAFRPSDGKAFSVEHGPNCNDEVNVLQAGGNYGWGPVAGGYDQNVPMTDKVRFPGAIDAAWVSLCPTIAPSGATFLSGAQWKGWDGALAISVLKGKHLRLVRFDGSGSFVSQVGALPFLDRMRSAVQGPDGKLYVALETGIIVVTPS